MSTKDTLEKAYGNMPKDINQPLIGFDILFIRPIKFYKIKIWRWITR